ncbi:hypothetical protein DFP72DRAFT_866743 [Ephemerocybe angulata]|uniref:B-block binding subunit of TFIIIC domain-containing protein n=1 Tax=Ephemerocybe angulata TaxID=980116 RepID=A0A8H6IJ39_9AGAR|nr:hypothetical protein DFP72DRAFT_866743 [Tulosesus angulatus]
MDELLHHCLRELSFDGDLGCDVSRLNDFVAGFYAHSGRGVPQNSDRTFCSFVWSLVVQHPTVVVGLVPQGVSSEVWVAPQTSAKRKAKASGQEHVETTPAKLELIPHAKTIPLEELVQTYGDRLRIAVEPAAIFAAVTGSHIRSSRMSPMVYSALQIITRGRDEGVTVVQLGQKSKYDQKTCFYLVKQLTEMDLVAKVRRGGVGTHFCIHKYFYDRSPSWQAIREEETQAEESQVKPDRVIDAEDLDTTSPSVLQFSPIDSRHLSSLPLVKARVVKLLKASQSQIHAANNLLITLGFHNPTKTDRRFFQSRIRELIQQGVIEKVIVPSNRKNSSGSTVKCFRLVDEAGGRDEIDDDGVVVQADDEKDDDAVDGDSIVKANITIHKQILDLLEESGSTGMTLNELSTALGNFDKRTIELFLARADKSHPPKHLADLGIAGLMETSGRERRHRYYTVAAYRELVSTEQLDKSAAGFHDIDLNQAGGFASYPESMFFDEAGALNNFEDTFHRVSRPAKKAFKNPILADGTVKKGRPRKTPGDNEAGSATIKKAKRKRADEDDADDEHPSAIEEKKKKKGTADPQVSKKRGRPRKVQAPEAEAIVDVAEAPPKKRGRASKRKADEEEEAATSIKPKRLRRARREVEVDQTPELPTEIPQASSPRPSALEGSRSEPPRIVVEAPPSPEVIVPRAAPPVSAEGPPTTVLAEAEGEITSQGLTPCEPQEPMDIDATSPPPTPASMVPVNQPSRRDYAEPSPSKDVAPRTRGRVNVSHLRRENEFLRVLEESGGIVNTQTKEFFDAHTALLDVLTKAGEPTSAPVGTRTDKRTAAITIEGLESKGKVKQLKTSVSTHTGVSKPANVVYLPSVEQERLNTYLAELSRVPGPSIPSSGSAVKIKEAVEYGADPTVTARGILPLQLLQLEQPGENKKERWSKNAARADQLFAYDDATIRDVLLAERTTQGQMYGFIVGRAARAREFHLSTLKVLTSGSPSPYMIPESRIVDLSYFSNELPVGLFTAFVSALSHSENLTNLFATEEGRNTPVKDLPTDIHTLLQVGRSRARSRILDTLDLLQSLKLVTPLKISGSEQPWITCPQHEKHPTAFDIASDHVWNPNTPHAAPTYWHFNAEAPLFLWSVSDCDPPFWKEVPVSSLDQAKDFWRLLENASIDRYLPRAITADRPAGSVLPNISAARTLRRPVSWNGNYSLTWHQSKFLEKSIDLSSGETALEEEDDEARASKIRRLCWVTSAPQHVVEDFLRAARVKIANDKAKLRGQDKEAKRLKKMEDSKLALARKAEEARAHRESQWTSLLEQVHPDDLGAATNRVEQVHKRFMQAGSVKDLSKWEKEVLDAIREADLVSKKVMKVSSKRSVLTRPTLPVFTSEPLSATGVTITALINQQKPLLDQGVYKRKPKNKKKAAAPEPEPEPAEEKKSTRRHRFQWNKEYDELARDASVIIRARCRSHARLDWTALEQVFPAVPRNTVRQRLSNIRSESAGNESYLRRLEDRWYGLWVKHRGTDALPDDHPESPSNFHLIQHIEFLRQNVDKNALRVGYGQGKEIMANIIPRDVASLLKGYHVAEETSIAPPWDFVWNAVVEEGREKRLLSQCFTVETEPKSYDKFQDSDERMLAEAALKMTMGSPHESYNCDNASTLLRSVGEEVVSKATQNMLGKGILSKSQRDPTKHRPGRQLKISDSNQNAMGGTIPKDTYNDAVALLESAQAAEIIWRDWPLTATDGDTVALIHLVSEGQVEFKVDTSEPQAARPGLDWNSKRADDDQIETAISVKYGNSIASASEAEMDWSTSVAGAGEPDAAHGGPPEVNADDAHSALSSSGNPVCCRQLTKRLENATVDCPDCLEESWSLLKLSLTAEETAIAEEIMSKVRNAGKAGCRKAQLLNDGLDQQQQLLPHVIQKLVDADTPLLYWVGYNYPQLVLGEHISSWTVVVSESPLCRVLPRRWLTIDGTKIRDYWQAALRAVMALIIFRPGVSQVSGPFQ